jgi:hypothetical protein
LSARWRPEIDALAFRPSGHGAECVLHRLAFRALTGRPDPTPSDCERLFASRRADFDRAAAAKIARRALPADAAFHLTSRDVARSGPPGGTAHAARHLDPRPHGS